MVTLALQSVIGYWKPALARASVNRRVRDSLTVLVAMSTNSMRPSILNTSAGFLNSRRGGIDSIMGYTAGHARLISAGSLRNTTCERRSAGIDTSRPAMESGMVPFDMSWGKNWWGSSESRWSLS